MVFEFDEAGAEPQIVRAALRAYLRFQVDAEARGGCASFPLSQIGDLYDRYAAAVRRCEDDAVEGRP
jgi:hypothetical protein